MRRLLAITDRRIMGPDPVRRIAELMEALGPALVVQVREKDLAPRTILSWLEALAPIGRASGSELMVNGRLDVALSTGAGVHFPEDGLPVASVRRLFPWLRVGASAHSAARARSLAEAGATLIAVSPIYETPSKVAYGAPLGAAELERAVRAVRGVSDASGGSACVFALGGVDRARASEVWRSGAGGIAAIRAVWTEPIEAVRSLLCPERAAT